jgi:hypothetical protein
MPNVNVKTTVHGKIVQHTKSVQTGDRGGLFYINAAGNKVYLKAYQRDKCLQNTLSSDTGVCRSGVQRQKEYDDDEDNGDDDGNTSDSQVDPPPPLKKKRNDVAKRAYGGFIAKQRPS